MRTKVPIYCNQHFGRLLWTFLLGTLVINLSFAEGVYSQQKDLSKVYLSIKVDDAPIGEVFRLIEGKTEFDFAYDEDNLIGVPKQTLDMRNAPLLKVLEKLSKNTNLEFKSVNNVIHVQRGRTQVASIQKDERTITGVVVSAEDGSSIPGATILVKGSTIGTATGLDGSFSINVPESGDIVLVVSFVGYKSQEIAVAGKSEIKVMLEENLEGLEEVVVVAFGEQKKESLVSSIATINPAELKVPASNLTTAFAGKIAGMIAYQRSGEPGADNASFFIRGVGSFGTDGKIDPLIMIDGMESTPTDLARLQPDDISGFSILKDATAASLYGARGANGVILVQTKSGIEGKTRFNIRFENSISSNTRNFQLADNITYMNLANEAVLTRDPLGAPPYTQTKIDRTEQGVDPYLYPSNNWVDQLIKDYTVNQRLNINVSGGGKKARYYLSGTYNVDNGILKVDKLNNFNSNIKLNTIGIRSNVDIDLTPTTKATVRMSGQFDDYRGPAEGGGGVFNSALVSNPVMFPARYPQEYQPFVKHPLFGNAIIPGTESSLYNNPYAQMVSGYKDWNKTALTTQLEIKQDFGFILPGLKADMMAFTKRYSEFDVTRKYSPFYYQAFDPGDGDLSLVRLNPGDGTEYLTYEPGDKIINSMAFLQAAIRYNQVFGEKHETSGMLITIVQHYLTANAKTLQLSLPGRNQGVSGRFTYGYDRRYMAEFNFGYNGSERFAKKFRYGFFPSVGLAWNINNEPFFESINDKITQLKLRGTYGLVGNDQIGSRDDRFYYLSDVNLNNGGKGYDFGTNYSYNRPGVSIGRYANDLISWEKAYKTNIGIEVGLFDELMVQTDVFHERRTSILMNRAFIPSTMGLQSDIKANVGEAESKGIETTLEYNKSFYQGGWLQLRGTFTYATNRFLKYEEPEYPDNEWYRTKEGRPINQAFGLIAERLFVDNEEVANSPQQHFGEYLGGDIKYYDANGDGQISTADMVPIGYPTTPEVIYGIGFSTGRKGFDFSAFFQGSARSSIFIDPSAISPFVRNENRQGDRPPGAQNGLLQVIADSYWSEDNRDLYAFWPRLSEVQVTNNLETSTWWMRNGAFLRLKTVELGYTPPAGLLDKWRIQSMRFYVNGSNLFVLSDFDLWDPEMGGNGLGYPVQRVFNMGVMVNF